MGLASRACSQREKIVGVQFAMLLRDLTPRVCDPQNRRELAAQSSLNGTLEA